MRISLLKGYPSLSIRLYDGLSKRIYIHRLVAETFKRNTKNLPHINHKDGNKLNNHKWNLEFCTVSYNIQHSYDIGLNIAKKGMLNKNYGKGGINHPFSVLVQCTATGCIDNINTAAKKMGVFPANMSRMLSGQRKNWTTYIKL